ncbi:IS200/IS605 family transposase [Vibrio aestuarianus]|uniref:IS200/IS605 family transposase n=1 Tax=Vibrio aestuarianus TaxID=28171 RepID=UPI0024687083|nr:IS200/IS605 family transposase [Vibrio aestuarianus]MDH5908858.1 IS200/IS605 family transposase [Vibrio aestuarianus]MDH5954277.1 IS200/IS605 family transposase [Vibrio aestuarianus]
MGDYRSSSHVYWRCKYHIVWTPKYRFKILKGRSAIRLFNKFPHIRKKLWGNHFWARGYFVDTVGVNEEIIRRYVRHQDKKDQEYEAQLELKIN